MKLKDLLDILYGDFTITAFTKSSEGTFFTVITSDDFKDNENQGWINRYYEYKVTSVMNLLNGLNVCCKNN